MKKTILLLSLFTVMSSIVVSPSRAAHASEIVDQEEICTASTVAQYVLDHLDLINQERVEAGFHNDIISATVSDILIDAYYEPSVIEGKLLIFDDYKGYMVVGPKNRYYTLSFQGHPPYNNFTSGVKVYDPSAGFCYLNDQGEKIILGEPGVFDTNDNETTYSGQDRPGECRISNPDSYMYSKYGNVDITMIERKSIVHGSAMWMVGFPYENIAFYKKDTSSGTIYSNIDGYCSAYSIFDYLARAISKPLYTNMTTFNYLQSVCEPDLYNARVEAGYTARVRKITQGHRTFRQHIVQNYGDDENLTADNIIDTMKSLYTKDEISVSKRRTWRDFMIDHRLPSFGEDYPVLFDARESITYNGPHMFAACGYRRYDQKTNQIGPISNIRVIFLVEVKDAAVDNFGDSTYVDLNAYVNHQGYMYYFSFEK